MTVVLGLLSALAWGLPDVPLAVAVRRVGQVPVLVGSLVIGTLAAVPVVLVTGAPDLTTRGLLLAALTGAVSVAGYLCAFAAYHTCPVSVVTPILSCEGAVAALIVVAAGEHLSPLLAVLLAASVLGVVLVGAGGGGEQRRAQGRGIALVVLATLFTGCLLALGPPVFRELGTWWGFLAVRAFTLVFALAFALGTGHRRALVPALRAEPWRIAVWGLGDAGAYLLYLLAADRGPIAVAGVLAAQFATFGTLAGVVLLGERLHVRQWLGVVVVIGAVSGIAAIT